MIPQEKDVKVISTYINSCSYILVGEEKRERGGIPFNVRKKNLQSTIFPSVQFYINLVKYSFS